MNLHYEFWVRYYDFLALSAGKDQIRRIYDVNKRIVDSKWDSLGHKIPFQDHSLCLKIQYPGLLVGLGNAHDSGVKPVEPTDKGEKKALQDYVQDDALKSEIGLGTFLDHVTGLPVIPGSQVKGMLRSAFISNPGYIAELLGWENGDEAKQDVCKLELDIFGGRHPFDKRKDVKTDEKGRDCFLDALPVIPGKDNRLFGIENITPHQTKDKKYARLNSPNILQLLKVIPGVIFQFRFILKDSAVGDKNINVQKKLELFSQIFQDLGVGAKTSVGFGGVETFDAGRKDYAYLVCKSAVGLEKATNNATNHRPAESRRPPVVIKRASQILPGVEILGKCLQDKKILLLESPRVIGIVRGLSEKKFKPGATVRVKVVSLRPNIVLEIL